MILRSFLRRVIILGKLVVITCVTYLSQNVWENYYNLFYTVCKVQKSKFEEKIILETAAQKIYTVCINTKSGEQMKTYRIHLIRHGKLDPSCLGKYIGRKTDVPVSAEGMSELKELREKLWYPEADIIFTSPMIRCVQTAHALYPDRNYMVVDALSECDFGIFENRGYEELKTDPEFVKWAQGGMKDAVPEGESGLEFAQRCYEGFSKVAEYAMKTGMTDTVKITANVIGNEPVYALYEGKEIKIQL